jgi:aspartyl-tRNA(Asn)/glutamyl-tRNA(Gln) amidotransferase subunit A
VRRMQMDELARAARGRFDQVDVIASPTSAETPPVLDDIKDWERYRPLNLKMARNTCVANILQMNAMTMPVALDAAGMPVGLQIMCDHGRDDLLFAASRAFEKVLGTGRQRLGPPPCRTAGV